MSRSDDLASIFASVKTDDDIGFRQGVVVSWDEGTGTNAVNVNGTVLNNLPCLNLGEFVILQPGDVVGLLRVKNTYFILGRIILPAGPDNNRASIGVASSGSSRQNFQVPGTHTLIEQQQIVVPDWADMITVHCTVDMSVHNTTEDFDYVYLAAYVLDHAGGEIFTEAYADQYVALAASAIHTFPNPGTPITVGARVHTFTANPWPADIVNIVNVNASASYWRVN